MDLFWSASTTMRNPERMSQFLETVKGIEGEEWNNDTQCKYQILLIKNRYYKPTEANLPPELYRLITDYKHEMTFAEASEIFKQKQYKDAPMRGRTSFDPLEKLGLVSLDEMEKGVKCVRITNFGHMFLNNEIDLGEVVFTIFLKMQFPNPLEDARHDYCIKPFIGAMHLIRQVNFICKQRGISAVGVSREEFGIFVLSLKSYKDVDAAAQSLIDFRIHKHCLKTDKEKWNFVYSYISDYLKNFKNPHQNIWEYTDNIIRYLRLTKYIYIRGGGYYIDLEPRRMIEIDAILSQDNGAAKSFKKNEYTEYISNYHAYTLPFETAGALTQIAGNIIKENKKLAENLAIEYKEAELPETSDELKYLINKLREHRNELQNAKIKFEYRDIQKIDDAITALKDTLKHKKNAANRPSIELEKWTNVAMNILDDAVLIKPNAPLGDDNEPTFTAPRYVPDIECYYDGFGAICEVTMLTGRDQWFNEGQPVMRHLRQFENDNNKHDNYCLFIAPKLHTDTINTFWIAVKHEYEGRHQKIVPITINGLIDILNAVRNVKSKNKTFCKEDLHRLLDNCVDISRVSDSTKWLTHINNVISEWSSRLA